jgi:ABC-2 type transport system permease protein
MIVFFNASFRSTLAHFKTTFARPMFQVIIIVQPIVMSTTAYFLYGFQGKENNFVSYVFLGSGVASIWSAIVFSTVGDIQRERYYGTLKYLFCSPTSWLTIMLGKIVGNAILSLSSLGVTFLYSSIVLNIEIQIDNIALFIFGLTLFLTSSSIFALTLGTIFFLSRSTSILQNFLEYPILILSGIMFTTDILPPMLRDIGLIIPLTSGSAVLREIIEGGGWTNELSTLIVQQVLVILVYCVLMIRLYFVTNKQVRLSASLDIY